MGDTLAAPAGFSVCGTYDGYQRHHRERTTKCDACTRAFRRYRKEHAGYRRVNVTAVPDIEQPGRWVVSIPYHPKAGQAFARTFGEIQSAADWLAGELSTPSRPVVIQNMSIVYTREL